MSANNPPTYRLDFARPNEQAYQKITPILWTNGRIYEASQQIKSLAVDNKALLYKSVNQGITWTEPDILNAPTVDGEYDYFFDGTKVVTFALFKANSGAQPLVLKDFDLDAETWGADYGNVAGQPTDTISSPPSISKMADGSIMVVFDTTTGGLHRRTQFAVFKSGAWVVTETDYATNIGGIYAQTEDVIPDPARNLIHVFYSDTVNFYYRQIHSDGTLDTITTLNPAFQLHIGNLNKGRAFNIGFIDGTNLIEAVFTRDGANLFAINILTATAIDTATPNFSLSAPIQRATSAAIGFDIGQAVVYNFNGVYTLLYFIGNQAGDLYNLVRSSTFGGGVWSVPVTIYDAMQDPNAQKNTLNNQWINSMSGGPDGLGNFVIQIASWGIFSPDVAIQKTTTLSTLVGAAKNQVSGGGTNTTGAGGAFTQNAHIMVLHIILPDPKVCKNSKQLNRRQFQTKFTLC